MPCRVHPVDANWEAHFVAVNNKIMIKAHKTMVKVGCSCEMSSKRSQIVAPATTDLRAYS